MLCRKEVIAAQEVVESQLASTILAIRNAQSSQIPSPISYSNIWPELSTLCSVLVELFRDFYYLLFHNGRVSNIFDPPLIILFMRPPMNIYAERCSIKLTQNDEIRHCWLLPHCDNLLNKFEFAYLILFHKPNLIKWLQTL